MPNYDGTVTFVDNTLTGHIAIRAVDEAAHDHVQKPTDAAEPGASLTRRAITAPVVAGVATLAGVSDAGKPAVWQDVSDGAGPTGWQSVTVAVGAPWPFAGASVVWAASAGRSVDLPPNVEPEPEIPGVEVEVVTVPDAIRAMKRAELVEFIIANHGRYGIAHRPALARKSKPDLMAIAAEVG
jgi:hypothetical protein